MLSLFSYTTPPFFFPGSWFKLSSDWSVQNKNEIDTIKAHTAIHQTEGNYVQEEIRGL